MDYNKQLLGLLKEVKAFIQYKRLPVIFRLLLIIPMLPIIIYDAHLIALYFIRAFILKGISIPFNILHDFVKAERDGKTDIVDAAICLVSMPVLVLYQLFLALFSFEFFINWFSIMCCTYIVTLGGVKWQPYVKEATFGDNLEGLVPAPSKKAAKLFSIFVFFAPILSNIALVITVIAFILFVAAVAIIDMVPFMFITLLTSTGIGAIIAIPLLLITALVTYALILGAVIVFCLLCLIEISTPSILIFIVNPLIFKLKPAEVDEE